MALDLEAARLPLSMLVVFGSAKLLDELFERLGQPGIVGQILAGVLIGPSVLGWIEPNEFLSALAELGVMFLLFRVGLEVKASELMKVGVTASLVAVIGVAVPLGLGWGLLLWWGHTQIESAFTGAAMVATGVGITAQVLAAKGLLQHRASKIILGAAIIDDILGLVILAVVSSLAKGQVRLLDLTITALLASGLRRLWRHGDASREPGDSAPPANIERPRVSVLAGPAAAFFTRARVGLCRRGGDHRSIHGRDGPGGNGHAPGPRSHAGRHRAAGSVFPGGHRTAFSAGCVYEHLDPVAGHGGAGSGDLFQIRRV